MTSRDHAFDLLRIGQPRDEEAAGAGIGEGLSALDRLVDQRIVVGLGLQEQVGAGVDEEVVADRLADRGDPPHLEGEWVEALAADHLVLEIAADGAGRGEAGDIGGALARDRRSRRPRNRPLAGARPRRRSARHYRARSPSALAARRPTVRVGDRMASGRKRLCARPRPPRARFRRPRYCTGRQGRRARAVRRRFRTCWPWRRIRTVARPTQMPATLSQNRNTTVTEHSPDCRYGPAETDPERTTIPMTQDVLCSACLRAACGMRSNSGGGAAEQQLKIVGSSTVYPFTTAVAEEFQRDNPGRQRRRRIDRHGRGHEAVLRRRRRATSRTSTTPRAR